MWSSPKDQLFLSLLDTNKQADRHVINTAILIFVNLNMPRYIKHKLRNMIKTCIVIRLTMFISIYVNPLNTYIQLKLRCKYVWR